MSRSQVSIRGLCFTYAGQDKPVIQNVDLEVAEGELVVLLGRSGCGKTTILRCMSGIIPHIYDGAMSGEVLIMGHEVSSTPLSDLAHYTASVFQQAQDQFFGLTVGDELSLVTTAKNEPNGGRSQDVSWQIALEKVGLNGSGDRYLSSLSDGELQRLAIAEALVLRSSVITMDEPSANLDSAGQALLASIIHGLLKQGKSVVVAEHRWSYLREMISRAVVLDEGAVIAAGHVALLDDQDLRARAGLRSGRSWSVVDDLDENSRQAGALEFHSVRFGYGKEDTLIGVNAEFPAGRINVLVGQNGHGKTTMTRLACGLLKERAGEIHCHGRPRVPRVRRRMVGLTFNCPDQQIFMETVREELDFALQFRRPKPKEPMIEALLHQFDLVSLQAKHPFLLSVGEKQRLVIATTVATGRNILALDEPTSGLDGYHMGRLVQCLQGLAEEGLCVFLATHDYELIASLGERVWALDGGHVTRRRLIPNVSREAWGNS